MKDTIYPTVVISPELPEGLKYEYLKDEHPNDEGSTATPSTEAPPATANMGVAEGSPILGKFSRKFSYTISAWGVFAKLTRASGKFYSLTNIVLDNLHPKASLAVFPVDPSEEEFHVINHFKSPAFILGRSGTGKTTCLIYKLASRYLSSKDIDGAPVRQV